MKRIILASASPRRTELIKSIVSDCECIAADIEEVVPEGFSALRCPEYLAEKKAEEIARRYPDAVVIGCDTSVFIDGRLLGKPSSPSDAAEMLRSLSGRTHTVITGVCIINGGRRHCFSESTEVTFKALTETEINDYVAGGEPMDKAGAYGIQGGGAQFVQRINGDYYNVVGLPAARLKEELINDDIISG